jgi:hypothetical protein
VHRAQEAGKAEPRVPMSPECFASLRAAQPGEPMAHKLNYQEVIGKPVALGTMHKARHCIAGGGASVVRVSA